MSLAEPTPAHTPTALDLFAGVGGLSEGVGQGLGGLEVVSAVEFDQRAAAGYELNHPGVDMFAGDIKEWVRNAHIPEVDLVIGGPPCQGFSLLGKRDADDERNGLWREYATAVSKAQPRYFVMENVPALLRSPEMVEFRSMTDPGGLLDDYEFTPEVVNAADHGAPQTRKRVIVIGRRKDMPKVSHPAPSHTKHDWLTVGDTIRGLGGTADRFPDRTTVVDGKSVPGAFEAREMHVTRNFSELSLKRFREIPYGGNRFDLSEELLAPCWRKHTSGSGDVMGRLKWEEPSVTIRTEFVKPEKGRYLHPVEDRAITPFEGALLQGFPEEYKFVGSMTDIVRQIGNAVPIPLGKALGRVIGIGLSGHEYDAQHALF